MSGIPVIDVAGWYCEEDGHNVSTCGASRKLLEAFQNMGAALLVNTKITSPLVDKGITEWDAFFSRSEKSKLKYHWQTLSPKVGDKEAGFYPFGSEKGSTLNQANAGTVNLNEYYHVKPGLPDTYPGPCRKGKNLMGDIVQTDRVRGFAATQKLAALTDELGADIVDLIGCTYQDESTRTSFYLYGNRLASQLDLEQASTFR